MRLTVGFFDVGLEWSGTTDIREQSLGGSETALYYMARHLADLGHEVKVCCKARDKYGKAHGVAYYDHSQWGPMAATMLFDVLISNRSAPQLCTKFHSNMNVLWCHDMPPQKIDDLVRYLWNVDKVIVQSQFQAQQYGKARDGLPEGWLNPLLYISRNGIDNKLIRSETVGIRREKKKLIYISRPERGLQGLLQDIWPQLIEQDPDLELHLCTYNMTGLEMPQHMLEFYSYIDQLVAESKNVHILGALTKAKLYKELASARALIYPCHFAEISPVRGDTIVETLAGPRRIDSMVGEREVEIYSCRPDGTLGVSRAKRIVCTRRQAPVITLRLRPGKARLCNTRKEVTLTLTPDHEVMLRNGTYCPAGKLQIGDRVRARWEKRVASNHVVVGVDVAEPADVYCMEVEPDHNFIVNGVVVHNCISVVEAMACGAPVITTDGFALPETCLDAARLIPSRPRDAEYREEFIKQTLEIVHDDGAFKAMQKRGYERAAQLDWREVAEEWDQFFHAFFEERFVVKRKRICEKLIYDSDLVVANKLAHEYPEELAEELELTDTLLKNAYTEPERYSLKEDEQIGEQWEQITRFEIVAKQVPEDAKTLLDVGCNIGMLFAWIEKMRDDLVMTGIDSSEDLIRKARDFAAKYLKRPGQLILRNMRVQDVTEQYDVVTCCETLEHIIETEGFVDQLERVCKPGGKIILTVPYGPWEAISFHEERKAYIREHVHHFIARDLYDLFGEKKKFGFEFMTGAGSGNVSPHGGELCGNWTVVWVNDPKRGIGEIDYEHKVKTCRPYQKIACSVIVKNEEDNILGCIKPILPIVDTLVIYDTGSKDRTVELAESLTAHRFMPKVKIVRGEWRDDEGFDWARNQALAHAGDRDWDMWQDADERLVNGHALRKYTHGVLFPGYILKQVHMMLDMHNQADNPVRLFRNDGTVRFFGSIHEHPEHEINCPLEPMLTLPDVEYEHHGYPTEAIRREKCVKRNLPLLALDRKKYPARYVGMIFLQRDYIHIGQYYLAANGGKLNDTALMYFRTVVDIYWSVFRAFEYDSYRRRWWAYSWTFYQEALKIISTAGLSPFDDKLLQCPFEIALALGGAFGGLESTPQLARRWFSTKDEYNEWAVKQAEELAKQLTVHRIGEAIL